MVLHQVLAKDSISLSSNLEGVEMNISGIDWENVYMLIFPNKALAKVPLQKGRFFEKGGKADQVILGKYAYERLKNKIYGEKIKIGEAEFEIGGVLSDSPYNDAVLLNGNSREVQKKFLSAVKEIVIFGNTTDEIEEKGNMIIEGNFEDIQKMSATLPAAEEFAVNSARFSTIYIQLIVVSIVCILLQFVQSYDKWKKEISIRKMVGSTDLRLVGDTFGKFFLLVSSGFLISIVSCFIVIKVVPTEFVLSEGTFLESVFLSLFIYSLINLVLLGITFLHLKSKTVQDIMREVKNA